jgi:hypothetical protein
MTSEDKNFIPEFFPTLKIVRSNNIKIDSGFNLPLIFILNLFALGMIIAIPITFHEENPYSLLILLFIPLHIIQLYLIFKRNGAATILFPHSILVKPLMGKASKYDLKIVDLDVERSLVSTGPKSSGIIQYSLVAYMRDRNFTLFSDSVPADSLGHTGKKEDDAKEKTEILKIYLTECIKQGEVINWNQNNAAKQLKRLIYLRDIDKPKTSIGKILHKIFQTIGWTVGLIVLVFFLGIIIFTFAK